MRPILKLELLLICILVLIGSQLSASDIDSLRSAHRLVDQGNYASAYGIFDLLAFNSGNGEIKREAAYYKGFCSVKMNDFWQAIDNFKLFKVYYASSMNTKFVPDAYYSLGRCYEMVEWYGEAKYEYKTCISKFPSNQYARKSRERLRILQNGNQHYRAAHYADVNTSSDPCDPFDRFIPDRDSMMRISEVKKCMNSDTALSEALKVITPAEADCPTVLEAKRISVARRSFDRLHMD